MTRDKPVSQLLHELSITIMLLSSCGAAISHMSSGLSRCNIGNVNTSMLPSEDAAFFNQSLAIPKNKSTGNLLTGSEQSVDASRMRLSFDAGAPSELGAIKR